MGWLCAGIYMQAQLFTFKAHPRVHNTKCINLKYYYYDCSSVPALVAGALGHMPLYCEPTTIAMRREGGRGGQVQLYVAV